MTVTPLRLAAPCRRDWLDTPGTAPRPERV